MDQRDGVAWGVDGRGIGRIRLCAPERANRLDTPLALALAGAIDAVLAARPRVVLLSAEGPVFCAGGAIDEFVAAGDRLDDLVDRLLDALHPALLRLADGPVPVVSAVGGAIGGAGVGLALSADVVLAASTMKLRTGYAALGLSPDLGTSHFLVRRVGAVRAAQWLMLSDPVDAAQCLACGAVDALHAPDALAPAAEALAARLTQAAPGSMAAIKALCQGAAARTLADQLALEHRLLRDRARSADAQEGVRAFVARRPPRFSGG